MPESACRPPEETGWARLQTVRKWRSVPSPPGTSPLPDLFLRGELAVDALAVLLQALHADPADEAAWLALADALEEQGQAARAELVRAQRAVRPLPEGPERRAAEDRIRALVADGVDPCMPGWSNSVG